MDEPLVVYRHSGATSLVARTPQKHLNELRLRAFERDVLAGWCRGAGPEAAEAAAPSGQFVIWGAGRDGRAFYNGLSPAFRAK